MVYVQPDFDSHSIRIFPSPTLDFQCGSATKTVFETKLQSFPGLLEPAVVAEFEARAQHLGGKTFRKEEIDSCTAVD